MKSHLLLLIMLFLGTAALAQVDTAQVATPDSTKQTQVEEEKNKKDKKKRDAFIIYTGVNFNHLYVPEELYDPTIGLGYHLGASYKRGRFFYWQIGGRYNNASLIMDDLSIPADSAKNLDNIFALRTLDVPITGGINFLSFIDRLAALRLFVSAIPSFTLGIGDNDLGINKDSVNSFIFYGQAGVGVDIAFLVIEAGYNYGFQDVLKNDIDSNPGQIFFNLGFRF